MTFMCGGGPDSQRAWWILLRSVNTTVDYNEIFCACVCVDCYHKTPTPQTVTAQLRLSDNYNHLALQTSHILINSHHQNCPHERT